MKNSFRSLATVAIAVMLIGYGMFGSASGWTGGIGSLFGDDDNDGTPNVLDPAGTIQTYDISGSIVIKQAIAGNLFYNKDSFKLNPTEKSGLLSMSVAPMNFLSPATSVTAKAQLVNDKNMVVGSHSSYLGDFGLIIGASKTYEFKFVHVPEGEYKVRFTVSYPDQEPSKAEEFSKDIQVIGE